MNKQNKQLLLKALCGYLPYGVKIQYGHTEYDLYSIDTTNVIIVRPFMSNLEGHPIETIKVYLRPMSSMTEDEAREITKLSGILTGSENILSISVKEEFIDIKIDDGVCSTETRTLWFTEMPTSITQLDYLNAHHFDYRGLIEKELALEAPEGMYN